jgi:hypothetical protein
MPTIKVATPFILRLDPLPEPEKKDAPLAVPPLSRMLSFPKAGEYDVDAEVADHWYTKMHLEGYKPEPPDTFADVRVMQTVEEAKAAKESEPATTS